MASSSKGAHPPRARPRSAADPCRHPGGRATLAGVPRRLAAARAHAPLRRRPAAAARRGQPYPEGVGRNNGRAPGVRLAARVVSRRQREGRHARPGNVRDLRAGLRLCARSGFARPKGRGARFVVAAAAAFSDHPGFRRALGALPRLGKGDPRRPAGAASAARALRLLRRQGVQPSLARGRLCIHGRPGAGAGRSRGVVQRRDQRWVESGSQRRKAQKHPNFLRFINSVRKSGFHLGSLIPSQSFQWLTRQSGNHFGREPAERLKHFHFIVLLALKQDRV
jgi:hypothetical protein